jgi:hypothetical protein
MRDMKSVMTEEPSKVREIMAVDVLTGTNALADRM